MLTVTERARETLARLKATTDRDGDADGGLRLMLAAGRTEFGLQLDRFRPGDQVVEHAGAKVLLVNEALAEALSDATIDAESSVEGDGLVITRREGVDGRDDGAGG